MLGGRSKLPVLAEIAGPSPEEPRAWALGRRDLARLSETLPHLAGRRVVLVAGEDEAARVAAIGVAAAAAGSGRRTVLLECDFQRPQLAAALGLQPEPGLHEYLRWEAQPEEILQPLLLTGPAAAGAAGPIACVCAGRPAPNAGTLLGLGSFAHALAKMGHAYELVVLLAPSLVADPESVQGLARQADAVLAGVPVERTSDRALRSSLGRLASPVLGAIAVAPARPSG